MSIDERRDRRLILLAGGGFLSALLGGAVVLAAQAMLPGITGDRARIEAIVRGYLLEKPEILREMVAGLEAGDAARARQAQVQAQAMLPGHAEALMRPFASAMAGNPQGDVTIVTFMDYACGYCRASLPALDKLIASDPGVRIVYREYPVLSEASVEAARWALAAAEQGRYRAFHDALFAAGSLSDSAIAAMAAKAGLDLAAARQAIRSAAVRHEIDANHKLGAALAISGTPTWVIGGKIIYGARDYQALADAVAQARKTKAGG